jgi:MFS transporter, MHS family, proline/betaine transporter
MCLGMFLGLLVAQGFHYFLSEEDLMSWGWRIPFILGLFIGLIGLYIRSHLSESPVYIAAKAQGALSSAPLYETVTKYWREVLMAMAVYINVTAPFYTTTVFTKKYMMDLGYAQNQGSITCGVILVTMSIIFPMSAYLSDKIGRKPILVWSSVALVICIYPIFIAVHTMNYALALLSQIVFSVILGMYMGPVPTLLVELFPTRVRFTGIAISYNISAALFGGTAPMVGAVLYTLTGEQISLAYYLTALSMLGLCSLYFYKETYRKNLSEL